MKKWKITIECKDEAEALVYIDMLKSTFNAAVLLGEDMNNCVLDDPTKGEKMICTLDKSILSWLKE